MVAVLATDPVALECTAPPNGPWATCALELCAAGLNRRRKLLAPACTPITTTCAFNATTGKALCDMTGLVEPGMPYDVQSTAAKADGRTSKTAPQAQYTLALFP